MIERASASSFSLWVSVSVQVTCTELKHIIRRLLMMNELAVELSVTATHQSTPKYIPATNHVQLKPERNVAGKEETNAASTSPTG